MRRILLFALVLAPAVAFAQRGPSLRDLGTARSYGMAGTFRAMGGGTETVDGNPAGLAVFRRYMVELSGGWDPRTGFGFGSIAVMDSVSSPVAAGLSYHLVSLGEGDQHRIAHINTAAFSLPFGNVLQIGISGRHVLETGARSANAMTADAGVLVNVSGFLISAAGHNLIDIHNPDFQRYFSLSGAWVTPTFSLAADARGDFNGPHPVFAWSTGGELVLGNVVPIRAGFAHDSFQDARYIGTGIGLIINGSELDLSYRHELGGSFSRLLGLTLRLNVR